MYSDKYFSGEERLREKTIIMFIWKYQVISLLENKYDMKSCSSSGTNMLGKTLVESNT